MSNYNDWMNVPRIWAGLKRVNAVYLEEGFCINLKAPEDPGLHRSQIKSIDLHVQCDQLQLEGVLQVIYQERWCEYCHMQRRGKEQYM